MTQFFPPASFFFSVEILGNSASSAMIEAGFQEVSGISTEMTTDSITEGGENRFIHKVPARMNSSNNLVLKRGLIASSSVFGDWCRSHLAQGLNAVTKSKKIEPKNIIVHLLDTSTQKPLISWAFARAYPVKWEISTLNAKENNMTVETLTLTYAYFQVF